jgi:hypothetical protein
MTFEFYGLRVVLIPFEVRVTLTLRQGNSFMRISARRGNGGRCCFKALEKFLSLDLSAIYECTITLLKSELTLAVRQGNSFMHVSARRGNGGRCCFIEPLRGQEPEFLRNVQVDSITRFGNIFFTIPSF